MHYHAYCHGCTVYVRHVSPRLVRMHAQDALGKGSAIASFLDRHRLPDRSLDYWAVMSTVQAAHTALWHSTYAGLQAGGAADAGVWGRPCMLASVHAIRSCARGSLCSRAACAWRLSCLPATPP